MGTPDIAVTMLDRLVHDGYQLVAVVTQPDKKVGRKQVLQMSPVKQYALDHNIEVVQPQRIKDEYDVILQYDADLIVTCAYGQFIPDVILQAPTYGSINVHASLLPKLRGGAPIHKAIMYGEKETGMSIMRMVARMDAGAVMAQCKLSIHEDETTGELFDRLAIAGADLLSQSLPHIFDGSATFVEQDESKATFAYTISKEEEYINFHQDVQTVYDHIRSLIPFPGGCADVEDKRIKFYNVRMLKKEHQEQPGTVLGLMDGGFAVAALHGIIIADEVQMAGKARMDAKAFCNGSGKSLINKCFTIPKMK